LLILLGVLKNKFCIVGQEDMYQGTTSELAEKTLYGPEDVSGHDW